jgi:hypothetical protein
LVWHVPYQTDSSEINGENSDFGGVPRRDDPGKRQKKGTTYETVMEPSELACRCQLMGRLQTGLTLSDGVWTSELKSALKDVGWEEQF